MASDIAIRYIVMALYLRIQAMFEPPTQRQLFAASNKKCAKSLIGPLMTRHKLEEFLAAFIKDKGRGR